MPDLTRPSTEVFDLYRAGGVVEIADKTQLAILEDSLIEEFPAHEDLADDIIADCVANWEHRTPLIEAARDKRFHGTFGEITVQALVDPVEEFMATSAFSNVRTRDVIEGNVTGFMLQASLSSTSDPDLGVLRRPVFIRRMPINRAKIYGEIWQRTLGPDLGTNRIAEALRDSIERSKMVQGTSRGSTKKPHLNPGVGSISSHD
jgi:hypothetical protein